MDSAAAPLSDESHPAHADALFTPRFWLACAMHFTGGMAASFYILFPLFIRQLGGSEVTIGVYSGVAGAAAVLARVPVGRFLDTQGRWRVLAAAGLLNIAAWLGFVWIDRLDAAFALLVVVHGIAGGSLFAAYFTYACDITPISRRSEGIAMFGVWGMLPNGLGPALGERLIAWGGFDALFVAATGFAATSLLLSVLLPETMAQRARDAGPDAVRTPALPYRALLVLLCTTFMFAVTINSVFVFLAPFSYSEGRGSVGSFFLSYALAAVAVRVFTGRLPDRIGPRRVLIPALMLLALGVLLVPHARGLPALIAVGAICGAGHGYAFPILSVLTVEQVSPAQRGRAMSWFTAMFDLGTTLVTPALGAIAEWSGYTAMFSSAGVGMLLTALAFWQRADARSRVISNQ